MVLGKQVCFGGRKPLRSRAIGAAQHSLTNRWFPSTLVEKQNQPTLFDHIELSILLLLHSFAQPLWHHTRAPTFRGVVCLNYFDFVEISAFLDAQICSGACRVAARKPFTVTASKRPRMTTGMHLYIYVCICVHVCVYVYVYVCVRICICICICTGICKCMCICTCKRMCVYMRTGMRMRMHMRMRARININMDM